MRAMTLYSPVFALVFRQDLHTPATSLGVTRVHAEQIAGEDRRLVAAGAGANFEEHVTPVVGILGQQHALQIAFQRDQHFFGFADFFHSHFTHVRVAVLEQRLRAFKIALYAEQLFIGVYDRLELSIFLGIGAEFSLIGNDFAVAEQRGQFLETVLEEVRLLSIDAFIAFFYPKSYP